MKIEVISRDSMKKFFKRVEDAEKLSESIDPFKLDEIAIISINSYSGCPYLDDLTRMGVKLTERDLEPSPVPEKYHDRTLILHFDDACPSEVKASGIEWKLFSEEQAKAIKVFAEKAFRENKRLIVHCTAGISRSGAVGSVLNNYFNKVTENNPDDYEWFWTCGCERQISPNPYVTSILTKVLES